MSDDDGKDLLRYCSALFLSHCAFGQTLIEEEAVSDTIYSFGARQ
jgi:hypothetical protein